MTPRHKKIQLKSPPFSVSEDAVINVEKIVQKRRRKFNRRIVRHTDISIFDEQPNKLSVTAEIHAPPSFSQENRLEHHREPQQQKLSYQPNSGSAAVQLHAGAVSMLAQDDWRTSKPQSSQQKIILDKEMCFENEKKEVETVHLPISKLEDIRLPLDYDQDEIGDNQEFTYNLLSGDVEICGNNSILPFLPILKAAMFKMTRVNESPSPNEVTATKEKSPHNIMDEQTEALSDPSVLTKLSVDRSKNKQSKCLNKSTNEADDTTCGVHNQGKVNLDASIESDIFGVRPTRENCDKPMNNRVVNWVVSSAEHFQRGYQDYDEDHLITLANVGQDFNHVNSKNENHQMEFSSDIFIKK